LAKFFARFLELPISLTVPVFIGVRVNMGVPKSGQGKLADLDTLELGDALAGPDNLTQIHSIIGITWG